MLRHFTYLQDRWSREEPLTVLMNKKKLANSGDPLSEKDHRKYKMGSLLLFIFYFERNQIICINSHSHSNALSVHLFLSSPLPLSLFVSFSFSPPSPLITYKRTCNQQHHQPQDTMCILPCIPSGQRHSSVVCLSLLPY